MIDLAVYKWKSIGTFIRNRSLCVLISSLRLIDFLGNSWFSRKSVYRLHPVMAPVCSYTATLCKICYLLLPLLNFPASWPCHGNRLLNSKLTHLRISWYKFYYSLCTALDTRWNITNEAPIWSDVSKEKIFFQNILRTISPKVVYIVKSCDKR